MSEIDPLILEMKANLNSYQAGIRSATRTVETQLGKQERSSKRLEKQMLRSSTSISTAFKGLAGTLATAFTGRELVGLIDSFTRLQNSLKVAGLEGDALAGVQERLRSIGSQYGVEVEALAGVFNKASLAQKELGASSDQILQLNEAIAASLKITGTSSQEASGALLQLGQALGSGIVRAEEFNSILEGALPLAQAAARGIDGFGGSVAKLRAAVADGQITSKQFFEGILKAAPDTLKQAESATLTLSGAFTVLRNELILYVGDAAKTSGVTVTLSDAIKGLADNLDTIIPALATIATILGVRYVAGAVAAAGATRALIAYLSIATTSLAGTALAARGLGAALLGAVGGPVGAAILALIGGIIYLKSETEKVTEASRKYQEVQREATDATKKASDAADALATAHGKARVEALALARAERENIKQKLASAQASLILAEAEATRTKEKARADVALLSRGTSGAGGGPDRLASASVNNSSAINKANANIKASETSVIQLRNALAKIDKTIAAGPPTISPGKTDKPKKGPKEPKDRTAEILARFNDDLSALYQEQLQVELQSTNDAEQQAQIKLDLLEAERAERVRRVENEKDYTDKQKQELLKELEVLYGTPSVVDKDGVIVTQAKQGVLAIQIERDKQLQLAREASDIAQNQAQLEMKALRDQLDLAKTQSERRAIALRIVDAYYDTERAAIQSALLETKIGDANYQILQAKLAALDAARNADNQRALEDTAGPLEDYINRIPKGPVAIGEEIERNAVSAIRDLNSGLADAIVNGENLGDVLENTGKRFIAQLIEMGIQLLFIKPLLESLGGSSGGGLFSTLGSIFASAAPRAAGGPVSAGEVYRINESGQEYFKPNTDGKMIAANQVNAMKGGQGAGQSQQGGVVEIRLKDDMLDARIISGSAEVVKIAAPQITNAAVSETFRRSSRPRI
ncbi:tape measure protein [Parasphingorhabdus sp.]|jgi:tape measure domain-containing protein|uniref:tape measure protein n=1 Tax=Parasphingorhabdus sp. TaxID=2709688 RepID=UPI0039E4C0D4